jgi:hypothetical protein
MSRGSVLVQFGFLDLDRNRRASVSLIQTSEASLRKPPPVTRIATQEERVRYRLRLHVIPASRTQPLRPDRDTPGVTHRSLQRVVILHEKIHLSHIEPEPVSRGTDIEPRTMACRNLNQVPLTVGTFHCEHRVQTVARIWQASTRNACIYFEKQRFAYGQRSIMCRTNQIAVLIDDRFLVLPAFLIQRCNGDESLSLLNAPCGWLPSQHAVFLGAVCHRPRMRALFLIQVDS